MSERHLTRKQTTVWEFLIQYFQEYRRSPLIREIQTGCQIASYKSALDRLNALERKGFIKRTPNKHRGIRVLRRHPVEPPSAPSAVEVAAPAAAEPTTMDFSQDAAS